MRTIQLLLLFTLLLTFTTKVNAQEVYEKPTMVYGQTRRVEIGGITVEGIKNYEDYVLIGISGLSVGQEIMLPGDEITDAVKRYWKHGLFSNVRIEADSIVDEKVYLKIALSIRPRVSEINIEGVKKGEKEDLEQKIGIIKGNQLTPNMIDKAQIIIKKYFDEKGFKNAEVNIIQRDDPSKEDQMIVDILINKNEKVKVNGIYITGNENIPRKKFTGNFFSGGLLKKTNEKGFKSLFKSKKFIMEKFEEDKERVIEKYNELGFRDAQIVTDSVVDLGNNLVDVYLNIDEGQKYYVRNINWVGNTIYNTDALNLVLRMKKGDVYNQKHIQERLNQDDDAVGNFYYNKGYVFNEVVPVEVDVDGDSIDLEIRIREGIQASINKIKIYGNTRVYEDVIRRELKLKPGDLFSMDAFKMTYQEIGQMGHFDPEQIDFKPVPDPNNGTVDLNLGLTPKASDQVEFSLGWGQTGVIGKIGLKFTNFSMRNLFGKNGNRRGILPQGDGQEFEISGSTNGDYYQSYSISFFDPWFGGKRPNQLSVSAFYSRQTDISSNYYNSSYYNSTMSMLYGYGNYNNSYYNNYSSYYDPDKYIQLFGLSIGWGKRLNWPDNNFSLSAQLAYTRYMLKDWEYFLITDGNCNNVNLTLTLSRTSIDNPIFPRRGSQVSLSVSATPPYSLFDNIDYKNLASSYQDASYMTDLQKKYRWIEYHKWKFNSKFYTPLSGNSKCFVLMTRFDCGFLGHYNKYKKSPFETFYMGGDGMSGYSSSYYSETIGLRGYDNGALTPGYQYGYAYSRMALELRYPLMLQGSTNIYALAFMEGGNAWSEVKNFNPFDMKRSAGFGVRLFLPMVGMMGIDWAYGFDKINGVKSYSGSQFHFILGQEF
ncbi:MAG: outer membrane protein assembly factor BamA [Bacteroides sp.]|nr:outer membrane protein assembly factor BamA [Bacteroides sp.]MCM1421810.1 outer membrane protein assembly factor BamA [Bacteroides sp.]